MIHLGVVQAIEQMNRAGPGGCQAHADLAGELRMRTGHEGGHFFMANLHELRLVIRAFEGAHDAVDAVARKSVDSVDAPVQKTLQKKIGNTFTHGRIPWANLVLLIWPRSLS